MPFFPNYLSIILDLLALLPVSCYMIWLGFNGLAGDEEMKLMVGIGILTEMGLKYIWLFSGNRGIQILNAVIGVILICLLMIALLFNLDGGEGYENMIIFGVMMGIMLNLQIKPLKIRQTE